MKKKKEGGKKGKRERKKRKKENEFTLLCVMSPLFLEYCFLKHGIASIENIKILCLHFEYLESNFNMKVHQESFIFS